MDLILWRHAEAEDGAPDEARALTPKGQRQAARVARWLRSNAGHDFRVIASPAVRAQQTAAALTDRMETCNDIAPGCSAGTILKAAGWPDGMSCVVLVGHQPSLGSAAALALTGQERSWAVRKGALWWLQRRHGETVVRAVLAPDMLRSKGEHHV